MRYSITAGEASVGLEVMRFTLTYDGELSSNDDFRKKWEIRNQIHPQLQELWNTNASLKRLERHRLVPARPDLGWWHSEIHHSLDTGDEVDHDLHGEPCI